VNKSILITGITGFLGGSLARFFLSKEYRVIGLRRAYSANTINSNLVIYDLDKISLECVFNECDIDVIINTATSSYNRGGDLNQIMDANVIFPLKLLEQVYNTGKCIKFINAGAFIPDKYIDSYFLSKKIFSSCMKEYSKYINIIDVQLQMLYGGSSSHTQFVSKIALDFLREKKYLSLTKGEQKRDLIYIDDAVSAFRAIVDNIDKFKDGYTEVDLGSGVSISIKHLVKKIKKITNNQVTCLEFGAIEYRSNEIMNSKANINLLKSLGWSPKINLDKGLHVTVNSLSHKQYDKNE